MKTNGKVENDGIGEYKECQTPRLQIRDDRVLLRGSHKSEKWLGDNLAIPKNNNHRGRMSARGDVGAIRKLYCGWGRRSRGELSEV